MAKEPKPKAPKLPFTQKDVDDLGNEIGKATDAFFRAEAACQIGDFAEVSHQLQILHARWGAMGEWCLDNATRCNAFLTAAGLPLPAPIVPNELA